MSYTVEFDFTRKILKNMKLNSYVITNDKLSDNHDIIRKNTITVVTDKFMLNYILFPFADTKISEIFICGPYITDEIPQKKILKADKKNITRVPDESVLFALFSALGESVWGKKDNFTIKKFTENEGILTETKIIQTSEKFSLHVQKAIAIIESDLTAELNLKSISDILGINESYFSSLFRKETGLTFTDYVNGKRIEHAKKLLRTTSLQIQAVAQYCGILDVNYFSRLFRKYSGLSPSAFRCTIE